MMPASDLADTAHLAYAAHVGRQVDPEAFKAGFLAGLAVCLVQTEEGFTQARNRANDALVEIAQLDPSLKSVLAAVESRARVA